MSRLLRLLAPAVVFALPLSAQEAAAPVTKFTADFGYVAISGNTDATTLSVGEKWTRQSGRLTLEQNFGIIRGSVAGVENTNLLRAGVRAEYTLGSHFSWYAGAAFDRNPFAGIERRFEEQAGLQYRPVANQTDTLRFESGVSATQQTSVDGTKLNFPAARAAGSWRHQFSTEAYFVQSLELLPNLQDGEDYRVNTESAIIAPVSQRIALRLGYLIRYDNLPEPTFRTTDRLFTTAIQLTFE
jgi:putative salt-induced outer membrane protein